MLGKEIWMQTGTSKQWRFIVVHDIKIPLRIRRNVPAYLALRGCDTVSQFSGHGEYKIIQSLACNYTVSQGNY